MWKNNKKFSKLVNIFTNRLIQIKKNVCKLFRLNLSQFWKNKIVKKQLLNEKI